MDPDKTELILATLKTADEKLHAARVLLKGNLYNDSASRAYYAAFHAAQAVLISEGYSAESHHGLKTLFGLHFIQKGKIESLYGKLFSNLQDDREEGDYEAVSSIDKEIAENALKEAEKFVSRMKTYLQQILK